MKIDRNLKKDNADLVLLGGTAITVDSDRRVIRDMGIAIRGEDIIFVGKAAEVSERYEAKQTLDCRDKVLIPGLVNAHIHFSQHLNKGLTPDNLGSKLHTFYIHSRISPILTVEDEIWGARSLLLETLKSGTTAFLEPGSHYPFDTIQSDIQNIGMKGLIGRRAQDKVSLEHNVLIEDTEESLKLQEELMKRFGKQQLAIRPHVSIVGMGRFTDRLVIESKKIADRYGTVLSLHLANYIDHIMESRQRTGYRPVMHLEKIGVLDENVVLGHMVHVNQKEVDILAKRRVKVVHMPGSALKIVHGLWLARFPEMIDAGIPVALATDTSDCCNYHDMVRTMYLAAVLFKAIRHDPEIMGAEQAIEMATINGAKAMMMEKEIGSLEAGKKADIAIFDTNNLQWRPLYNEVQNLVYSANGNNVETVIINGKVVMDKRRIVTVDEEKILAGVRTVEERYKAKLNPDVNLSPSASPWKFI